MSSHSKIKRWFDTNRKLAAVIFILVLLISYGLYRTFSTKTQSVHYVLAAATKNTVIASVSGTGQVSTSNQVDIKPKVSGDVTYIAVKNGDSIKAGALIAQLDAKDAQKSVRDAQANLDSARLSLEKLALSHEQQRRGDSLNKSYEDGMTTLGNIYSDSISTLNGIHNILFNTDLSNSATNIGYYASFNIRFANSPSTLATLYQDVQKLHELAQKDYQDAKRGGGDSRGNAIQSGYAFEVKLAEFIKSSRDVIQAADDLIAENNAVHDKQTTINSHLSSLSTYATTANGYVNNLLTTINSINSERDTEESYPLDEKSQELNVRQQENALKDAQDKLADYYIRAPFAGIVAKLNINQGDTVSSGTSLGTLITTQKIATISLNEVDVAKAKVGEKVTLTFDAIDGLNISGVVQEIDSVGTVTQGVVTYNVKIVFDTQDDRVKSGMSVSAAIITDSKTDVLTVPNSAVKKQGVRTYVQITSGDSITPTQQDVETGLSNDTITEITSGLKENEKVVTQTVTSSATTQTQTSQAGGLRIPGLTGGSGIRTGGGGFNR